MIGLKKGTVQLVDYDPQWVKSFEVETLALLELIGSEECSIEHIGSTSIDGLPAKPIIDLMIGFCDMRTAKSAVPLLVNAGYIHRTNGDLEDRVFFVKGPESCRTHHISLTARDSHYWQTKMAFRKALRENQEFKDEYSEIKLLLAEKHPDQRYIYTSGKLAFINKVLQSAGLYQSNK